MESSIVKPQLQVSSLGKRLEQEQEKEQQESQLVEQEQQSSSRSC